MNDICYDSLSLSIGSTLATHHGDEIVDHGCTVIKQTKNRDHKGRFYIVRVTKIGR